MYSISSDLPHTNEFTCAPRSDTFFMSLNEVSLIHTSGYSSNRDSVKTTVSALRALFTAPNALSSITTFAGAAVVVRLASLKKPVARVRSSVAERNSGLSAGTVRSSGSKERYRKTICCLRPSPPVTLRDPLPSGFTSQMSNWS